MDEENVVAELVEGVDYVRVMNECDVVFSDDFWEKQRERLKRLEEKEALNARKVSKPKRF